MTRRSRSAEGRRPRAEMAPRPSARSCVGSIARASGAPRWRPERSPATAKPSAERRPHVGDVAEGGAVRR